MDLPIWMSRNCAAYWLLPPTPPPRQIGAKQVLPLLYTVLANSSPSAHRDNLRTRDRATRLQMAYVRDLLNNVGLSRITCSFNISDGGTETNGNITLWASHIADDLSRIGSISRKGFKSMAHFFGRRS